MRAGFSEPARHSVGAALPIIDLDRLIDNLSRELDGLAAFPVGRPDLWDEIWEYVSGLGITPPMGFDAETVALYRLTSPSWTGEWWRQMSWTHVRSWHLSREASQR
jgi:hypothetical protein